MAAARNSKEVASRLHEKHQTILADLLREEENRYCADCLAKGPRWASWNLGVFMCIRCAGIHRNLGVHISRVKSVNLDSWTPEQIESIQRGGNKRARELYEATLPANFKRPQDDYAVESFIRGKYERKLYIARGEPEPSRPKQQEKAKSKKTENRAATVKPKTEQLAMVPRPARRTPSPQTSRARPPTSKPQPLPLTPAPAELMSQETATPSGPVDLLTDLPSPGPMKNEQPLLGVQPSLKDNIMSLYTARPQHAAFTAQGMPVNAYYYQQHKAAAVRMAQQQQQVDQVTQQMQQLKMQQHRQPVAVGNTPPSSGQTLNPHLW